MDSSNLVERLTCQLEDMATHCRRGEFDRAEAIGNSDISLPLAISKASIRLGRLISEGGQATIHEAFIEGREAPCAVKRAIIREPEDLIRFRKEVALLGGLKCPYIVEILAARMLPPDYCFAMAPLCDSSVHFALHERNWRPSLSLSLRMGAQIALALDFLHSRGVVHRDVKPSNFLVVAGTTGSSRVYLADLGIAALQAEIDETFHSNTVGRAPSGGFSKKKRIGTIAYMAPELLTAMSPSSPASDVFALCVAVNEIINRSHPYSDCTRENPLAHTILELGYGVQELAVAVAAEGLRPTIGDHVPEDVAALLRSGWSFDMKKRPTAAQMAVLFETLAEKYVQQDDPTESALADALLEDIYALQDRESIDQVMESLDIPAPPQWLKKSKNCEGHHQFLVASFASAGRRGEDQMEDRTTIIRNPFGSPDIVVVGVFDGHRGKEASEFLCSEFEYLLRSSWTSSKTPASLLMMMFDEAESRFRSQQSSTNLARSAKAYPGSTAVCAILHDSLLTVAHVGDSRAMISRDDRALFLTKDHTLDRSDERQRVLSAGGKMVTAPGGSQRLGDVGLQVTRSIGDFDLKSAGLIHTPEINQLVVEPSRDTFLVIATDGVFDALDGDEIIQICNETVKQPAMCAQRIVTEAIAKGSEDNASACILFIPGGRFEQVGTVQKVFEQRYIQNS